MPAVQETIDRVRQIDVDQYKYGFETLIESDKAPKGLNEDIIRFISAKKGEPEWLLEWRLKAYRHWLTMPEPTVLIQPAPMPAAPAKTNAHAIHAPQVSATANAVGGIRSLEEIEREQIIQTLGYFSGNRVRTAKALGIGVRTLGLKLKKWKELNLVAQTI